jgi:hypothetical protein
MPAVPKIEFYYYDDCPSHERALERLREAAGRQGIDVPIEIIRVASDEDARRYSFYGSPTIRVNGADIAPLPEGMPEPALACRAYRTSDGRVSPLPPFELITAALHPFTSNAHSQAERKD